MNIFCLKLTTGEQIVGELIEDETSHPGVYTVNQPLSIFFSSGGDNGQIGIGLGPFISQLTESKTVRIDDTFVMVAQPAAEQIKTLYCQQTGRAHVISNAPNLILG